MKRGLATLLAAVLICSLTACGGGDTGGKTSAPQDSGSHTEDTVYTVSIGHGASEDTAQQMACLAVKEYLEKESNGRFKVEIYPNNQVGSNREMTEALIDGSLVMAQASSGTQASFVPDASIFDVPFAWTNEDEIKQSIYDPDLLAALDAAHQAVGMKLLSLTENQFRQLSANKEIHTPDDCKGLIIRTQENSFQMQTWSLLGANPTPLAFNELYTALQQGTVEAQDNPLELFVAQKFYEQQDYFIKTNYLGHVYFWYCNLDWYNALPDDLREMFDYATSTVLVSAYEDFADSDNSNKLQVVEDNGVQVIELTDEEKAQFKELVTPVWSDIEAVVSEEVWTAFTNTLNG